MNKDLNFDQGKFLQLASRLRIVFSLNEYESKVFAYLLIEPKADVKKMAFFSNIPRSRVYDITESLEKEGLIKLTGRKKGEKKLFAEAIKYDEIIKNIKERMLANMNNKIRIIKESKMGIKELINEYTLSKDFAKEKKQ